MKKLFLFLIFISIIVISANLVIHNVEASAPTSSTPAGLNYINPATAKDQFPKGSTLKDEIVVETNANFIFIGKQADLMVSSKRIIIKEGQIPTVLTLDKAIEYKGELYIWTDVTFKRESINIEAMCFSMEKEHVMLYKGNISMFRGVEPYLGTYDTKDNIILNLSIDNMTIDKVITSIQHKLGMKEIPDYIFFDGEKNINFHVGTIEFDIFILFTHYKRFFVSLTLFDNVIPIIKTSQLQFENNLIITKELIIKQVEVEDNRMNNLTYNITWTQNSCNFTVTDEGHNSITKDLPITYYNHPSGPLIIGPNTIERLVDEPLLTNEEIINFFHLNTKRSDYVVDKITVINEKYKKNIVGNYEIFLNVEVSKELVWRYPVTIKVTNEIPNVKNISDFTIETTSTIHLTQEEITSNIETYLKSYFTDAYEIGITDSEYENNWSKVGTWYVFYKFKQSGVDYLGKLNISVRKDKSTSLEIIIPIIVVGSIALAVGSILLIHKKKRTRK
jgi:hypothetical protein